ncbi:MAG: lysophospholipid acyltransferase family protein [Tenuifilaceae bacterium]|nr:lysophospholipid acyltransferase family protein [Tenuifilaceae bacterium]
MIKPNHSKFHSCLIDIYIRTILKTDFREVIITGDLDTDSRPVLLISNHFSWWDGFFAWHLNKAVFKKKFHVLMLEEQLSQLSFFSRIGAFSVKKGSRSVIESLNFCSEVLSNPNNLLVLYPQGKIEPQHKTNVVFQRGIERILAQTNNVRIVFASCITNYFSYRKPTLTLSLAEYNGNHTLVDIEQAYNNHLSNSFVNQENILKV